MRAAEINARLDAIERELFKCLASLRTLRIDVLDALDSDSEHVVE